LNKASGLSRALGPSDSAQCFRPCGNHLSELLTIEAIYPRALQVDLLEAGHRGTRGSTSQPRLCSNGEPLPGTETNRRGTTSMRTGVTALWRAIARNASSQGVAA
jgi:hypothetical protein